MTSPSLVECFVKVFRVLARFGWDLDPEFSARFPPFGIFTRVEDCDGRIKKTAEMGTRQAEVNFIY